MSALPPKADIETQSRDVRFVPIADIVKFGLVRFVSPPYVANSRNLAELSVS